jgi:nitroreductase
VVIVACAATDDHIMPCGLPCFSIDVAIALDHITLAAVEQGLGTCWIGAFHQDQVKQILGIPDEIRVVELMPLGYPADPTPIEKRRLPLTTIVHNERW